MLNISWNSKTNNKENKVVNDNIAIFSHQIKGENKITIKKVKAEIPMKDHRILTSNNLSNP